MLLCSGQQRGKDWLWKPGWETRMWPSAGERPGSIQEESCILASYLCANAKWLSVSRDESWKSSNWWLLFLCSENQIRGWEGKPVGNVGWGLFEEEYRNFVRATVETNRESWLEKKLACWVDEAAEQMGGGHDFVRTSLCRCDFSTAALSTPFKAAVEGQ